MQKGYLIGTDLDGVDNLLFSGDPREARSKFKNFTDDGFSEICVVESTVGRTRRKRFMKAVISNDPPQPEPDALDEIEGDGEGDALPDIESLKELAKGDKRRGDVKDAISRLEELGVEI
jgi:hypothetical protein